MTTRHDGHGAPCQRSTAQPAEQAARCRCDDCRPSGGEIDFAAGLYGALKAAIIHYTQGLAYNWACKGICANSVSAGNTYLPSRVNCRIEGEIRV